MVKRIIIRGIKEAEEFAEFCNEHDPRLLKRIILQKLREAEKLLEKSEDKIPDELKDEVFEFISGLKFKYRWLGIDEVEFSDYILISRLIEKLKKLKNISCRYKI